MRGILRTHAAWMRRWSRNDELDLNLKSKRKEPFAILYKQMAQPAWPEGALSKLLKPTGSLTGPTGATGAAAGGTSATAAAPAPAACTHRSLTALRASASTEGPDKVDRCEFTLCGHHESPGVLRVGLGILSGPIRVARPHGPCLENVQYTKLQQPKNAYCMWRAPFRTAVDQPVVSVKCVK